MVGVTHRTAPYSEQQLRWAYAAAARGELAPRHVRTWQERAKRRRLPESVGEAPQIEIERSPDGFPHAAATVKKMGQLIREFSSKYDIRHLATEITKDIPSKSATKELYALYQWVRRNIRYRKDPRFLEWLQTPTRILKEGAGDCDCIATLIGALAESLGHPTRIITVGETKTTPRHVAVEAWDGKRWVMLDPVLEGSGDTGSIEPGKFGLHAKGERITWDTRGLPMLGAVQTTVVKPVRNEQSYDLWSASAFKLSGVGADQIWAVREGAIPGTSATGYVGDMGFSLKKIGRAIGKGVKGIAKGVLKVAPGILKAIPLPQTQAAALALEAAKKGASLLKGKGKGKAAGVKAAPTGLRPMRASVPEAGGSVEVIPMLAASLRDLIAMAKAQSALSGIKPTISFQFGGIGETAAASDAIAAVNAFIKKKGEPPQIALAAVRTFQALDAKDGRKGALSIDGLWGPNSQTAAKWYTGQAVPPVAKPYLKYAITWVPPAATVPPPSAVTPVTVPSAPQKPVIPISAPTLITPTVTPTAAKPAVVPTVKPVTQVVALKPVSPTAAKPAAKPTIAKLTPVAKTTPPKVTPTAVRPTAAAIIPSIAPPPPSIVRPTAAAVPMILPEMDTEVVPTIPRVGPAYPVTAPTYPVTAPTYAVTAPTAIAPTGPTPISENINRHPWLWLLGAWALLRR